MKNFSDAFRQLQAARHAVDYDPMLRLNKIGALSFITLAEDHISALGRAGRNDKIAFVIWVLIMSKGATEARVRNPRQI